MNHESFDELASLYALDTLDGDDLRRFRAHLAQGCAQCDAFLREARETLAGMAAQAPSETPPASVKTDLLARASASRGPRRSGRGRRWVPWVLGTAAAAIAAAFFTGMFVAARYEARLGNMARETSALRTRIERDEATLRAELAGASRVVELVRDPATRVVTLRGPEAGSTATGRIVWHAVAGGHLFVANLPAAPPDKAYELWTIAQGTPRPAGIFQVDASGKAGHHVQPVPDGAPVEVFAVTLEPAGGVPAPTGPIVLASAQDVPTP